MSRIALESPGGCPGADPTVQGRPVRLRGTAAARVAFAAALAVLTSTAGAAARDEATGEAAGLLGLNFTGPLDWSPSQVYADVIRQSRAVEDFQGHRNISVDDDGWPRASEFRIGLWSGIAQMHGTYTVYFDGTIREPPRVNGADRVGPVTVHRGSTRRFTFHVSNASRDNVCQIDFRGATRVGGGPGLTDIRVMRPLAPGSDRSYPPTALFNDALKTILRKVQVVRFMDFLGTNASQQVEWRDRPTPSWMSFARHVPGGDEPDVDGLCPHGYCWEGIGGPLEHVVLLANEIDRDPWVCIPPKANDDYVTKVAQLIAFGSDGVLPYTGPHGSIRDARDNPRPASHDPASWTPGTSDWYPPLKPGLKVYVEYGNELWNSAHPFHVASRFNRDRALEEIRRGGSNLAYDGDREKGGARLLARRGVEISTIFRKVFGDGQMPLTGNARVRPVLASFQHDPGTWLGEMLKYLHGYWNNGEGSHVRDPRPPGYYFYGAGGAAYYSPAREGKWDAAPTLDGLWRSWDMDAEHWRTSTLQNEAYRCASFGLRRIAYEGGPDFGPWQGQAALLQRAVADPRIKQSILEHHRVWHEMGGDLIVYFTAVGDYSFGWASDVNAPSSSYKMQALDQLRSAPAAPPSVGVAIPGSAPGAAHAGTSTAWEAPAPRATGSRRLTGPAGWAGYAFRAESAASRQVKLTISGGRGEVAVYLDGVLRGQRAAARGTLAVDAGRLGPGLHGVVVRAVSGTFALDRIELR